MEKQHHYSVAVKWTGNSGHGTITASGYDRDHTISVTGKADIAGSSDASFRGDSSRHNPEDMLVSSLSACHMLWYLHLCADAGVVVTAYTDNSKGTMLELPDGSGHFMEVLLRPQVTVKEASMVAMANELHSTAHQKCFIANSCNFPVRHEAKAFAEQQPA